MNSDSTVRVNLSPFPVDALARFRNILSQREAMLLESCRGLSHVALRKAGDAAGDVIDDGADLAAETCEQALSLSCLGRAQEELQEIALALGRMDRRCYGLCEGCGRPIPSERLEAVPTADRCIPCKVKAEED